MSSKVSKADIDRWTNLSEAQQRSIAARVARQRSRKWRKQYPNVQAAGVGYRLCDSGKTLCDEICLKFSVSRKRYGKHKSDVPRHVLAFAETRGSLKRIAIPTDVDELCDGCASGAMDMGDGIIARPGPGGAGLNGAVYCLIRDADAPSHMYALGCHHVFTRALQRTACVPDATTHLIRQDNNAIQIGRVSYWANLSASRVFAMDLAAVRVTNEQAISAMNHGTIPRRRARMGEEPTNYRIHTPRGQIAARYVSELFDVPLRFRCGSGRRTLRFASVFQSRAHTVAGDSGSPLIGTTGTLYGMHFYRYQGFALALPSYQLFAERNLNMRMRLVTNHDP